MASDIEIAIALQAAGRAADARSMCQRVLARDPGSVEARCVLATILLQEAGGGGEAKPWLQQACALQPSYPPTHYYLAIQRGDRGDIEGMRTSARRAQALLDPASEMAASLRSFTSMWAWLDDRRVLRLPGGRRTSASPGTLRWLFVWRDLSEFLYHFDRSAAGSRRTLWLPEAQGASPGRITDELIRVVEAEQPDIVAFLPGAAAHQNPAVSAFRAIRDHGIPTALIVPDMRKSHWQGVAAIIAPFFDAIVPLDGCSLTSLPSLLDHRERFFRGWAPISAFSPLSFADRPYTVNLVGSLWGKRVEAINALRAAGIDVVTRPPQPAGPREADLSPSKTVSNEAYFDLLRKSRLTLNLSASSTGDGDQLKARVFEAAACGSMLLESRNDMTRDYFEEGREFIYFEDCDDLVAKVRHYLAHPEQAAAIAAAAHRRFLEQYAAPHFWRAVYDHASRHLSATGGSP